MIFITMADIELISQIKSDIYYRAVCDAMLKCSSTDFSPCPYAFFKLKHCDYSSIICIIQTTNGKYFGEILFNKEHIYKPYRIAERISEYTKGLKGGNVYIAISTSITSSAFPYEIYDKNMETLADALSYYGLSLEYIIY